jgi:hypothetical protein
MSILENIVKAVATRLRSQGQDVKVGQLVEDWALAEKYFDEFIKGSTLLGLSELPDGFGNYLLFSKSQNSKEATASLEAGGNWIRVNSPISSLAIKNDQPFSKQDHSVLISQVYAHIGKKVVAVKLWRPLPHLALQFSDGSLFAIHGDNGQYESWGFYKSSPEPVGVYTLPGGPIVVG